MTNTVTACNTVNLLDKSTYDQQVRPDTELWAVDEESDSDYKGMVVGWGMPDYSSVISISTGSYTPPKDGLIRVKGGNNSTVKSITVNGTEAAGAYVNSTTSTDICAWVQKNDAVTITGTGVDVYFYPLKGV